MTASNQGWWRYTLPGFSQIDRPEFLGGMADLGFKGA